jgi:hypothetical protein
MEKGGASAASKKATILENYFVSSCNSSIPGPLRIPLVKKRLGPKSNSEASTSCKDDECMILKRANIVVQLIYPRVLVGVEILDGVKIINITDDTKAAGEQRKRILYEVSRKCQDHWVVQHSWAKMVHGDGDTIVHWVKCKIYSSVKGKPVTMGPKSDMLKSMQRSVQLL